MYITAINAYNQRNKTAAFKGGMPADKCALVITRNTRLLLDESMVFTEPLDVLRGIKLKKNISNKDPIAIPGSLNEDISQLLENIEVRLKDTYKKFFNLPETKTAQLMKKYQDIKFIKPELYSFSNLNPGKLKIKIEFIPRPSENLTKITAYNNNSVSDKLLIKDNINIALNYGISNNEIPNNLMFYPDNGLSRYCLNEKLYNYLWLVNKKFTPLETTVNFVI